MSNIKACQDVERESFTLAIVSSNPSGLFCTAVREDVCSGVCVRVVCVFVCMCVSVLVVCVYVVRVCVLVVFLCPCFL